MPHPSHICVLTSVHQPFDGRIFYRQCKSLAQVGYRVTLVAPADFEQRQRDRVTILGVPRPNSRLGRPLTWWRLYRQVLHLRPDVVHFHDPELLLLVPWLRARLGRQVKLVYDVHEYFVDSLAGKYWIPAKLRPLVRSTAQFLERLLVRGVDGIILAVKGQKSLYNRFRGPTAVVRNLPFASLFKGGEPHPDLQVAGCKLIYVGLILPKRGINVLLQAMHLLREREREDIYLFLIGPETSPAFTHEMEEFIQRHQLDGQVRWLGYVPHDQIKHYLANADIGVAPGRRTPQYKNQGISTKLFEYMLMRLPIISADHPHRRIYLEESDCGLAVPPEDAAAWAEAITHLCDHPNEARAMGERGRAMVLEHYTWEQEQDCLHIFYQNLLKDDSTPPRYGGA